MVGRAVLDGTMFTRPPSSGAHYCGERCLRARSRQLREEIGRLPEVGS